MYAMHKNWTDGHSRLPAEAVVQTSHHLGSDTMSDAPSQTAGLSRFPFPFQPYDVQEQLMEQIFSTLDAGAGSIGLFESPTGNGAAVCVSKCGA